MKSLALAAAATMIATSAFAAGIGSVGSQLVGADIRTNDGSKVGFVTGVESNTSVSARVDGQKVVLTEGDFRLVQGGEDFDLIIAR